MSDAALAHAQDCTKWWARYYHLLLALHMTLGVVGVVVGALIAAGSALGLTAVMTSWLGVISSVIVGLVSFAQPGRLATVFYDAYWHLKLVVLKNSGNEVDHDALIEAMSDGYTRIATIQPEALRKAQAAKTNLDISTLSDTQKEALQKMRDEFLAEDATEPAQTAADPEVPPSSEAPNGR